MVMHPLRGLLQPGPVVDGTANHKGFVEASVRDFLHRPGLGLLPQLPVLLGDALGNALGRSMFACVGNEYRHLWHSSFSSFTSRKKSTLRIRLTTTMAAINSSTQRLAARPLLLAANCAATIPIPVSILKTSRGIATM